MAPSTERRYRRVHHPAFVVAVVVLVVNDVYLEPEFPGPATGKLSDAAGLFLLGAIGFDVLDRVGSGGRARLAYVTVVAVTFALIKTVPGITDVAEAMAGALLDVVGRGLGWLPIIPPDGDQVSIVTDPADLLALPFLVVPLAVSRRGSAPPGAP